VNVGHAHPQVVSAVQEQAGRFLHVGINVTPYESYIRLCERLNASFSRLHPIPVSAKSVLINSGAEAVENAIKVARVATQRQAVVCFDHAFHGRTYMAMTLTSKYKPYKYGFGPFNSDIYRAPFPYVYRWPGSPAPAVVAEQCFQEFLGLAQNQLAPTQIAAVIFEPVLGEGGFLPMLPEFLTKVRQFCSEHKIVLIADEIQTGFCRTGAWFAAEHDGVVPDLITTAKGIAGGLPLAAVTGRAEIMDAVNTGGLGGTYGGNPVACAAALGAIATMRELDLAGAARNIETIMKARLGAIQARHDVIGDIRGRGAMIAIELVRPGTTEPNAALAGAIAKACHAEGVVVLTAGTYGNVLRFLPPLVIPPALLNEGLDVIEHAIDQLAS